MGFRKGVTIIVQQLHKRFSDDQTKELIRRYLKHEIGRSYVQEILGIKRRPVPIEGSNFISPVDVVVCAIGNSPNPLIPQATPDLKVSKWGNIEADKATMKTSKKACWAGGDVVRGGATVILAMGDGRVAANSISAYLKTGVW